MVVKEKKISGVFEISLEPKTDKRGFFMRTYDKEIFEKYGIERMWVQENHSRSDKKGIIRGLHFQFPPQAETKLIRCIKGAIFDVFVDLRKGSSTFGQWDSIELSEDNKKMIFIPRGFAHAFCTLTETSEVIYKVDNPYKPEAEGGVIWNDETLNISWPVRNPILSEKDSQLPTLSEFIKNFGGIEV